MKRILYILFLLVVIGTSSILVYARRDSYIVFYTSLDPCKKPITYKVGTVDSRFGLDMDEVVEYSIASALVWNKNYGSDLFVYDANGELTINMIFDERQQASNKINKLDGYVGTEKDKLEAMIAQHRSNVASFKIRLADHNKTVESWNSQGGAPEEEFKKMTDMQNKLETEAQSLNTQAEKLNLASEDYNLQVGVLNEAIENFNEDLEAKPEEGIYIGEENRIEIYFNNNRDELIHTIAHELGHARGLDHNNSSKSVMYPYSTKIVSLSDEDTADLVEVCRPLSLIDVIKTRLNL